MRRSWRAEARGSFTSAETVASGRRIAQLRWRNDILRATRHLGRTIWKKWSGDHVRSRIEARMRNLKSFGERIVSRDPDRQTAEIHIRVALMNRFNDLGTAEIERVA